MSVGERDKLEGTPKKRKTKQHTSSSQSLHTCAHPTRMFPHTCSHTHVPTHMRSSNSYLGCGEKRRGEEREQVGWQAVCGREKEKGTSTHARKETWRWLSTKAQMIFSRKTPALFITALKIHVKHESHTCCEQPSKAGRSSLRTAKHKKKSKQ